MAIIKSSLICAFFAATVLALPNANFPMGRRATSYEQTLAGASAIQDAVVAAIAAQTLSTNNLIVEFNCKAPNTVNRNNPSGIYVCSSPSSTTAPVASSTATMRY